MENSSLLSDLKLRYKKIAAALRKNNLDAVLISSNVNLIYTVGELIDGYFYLNSDEKAFLFIRKDTGLSGDNIYNITKPEQIPDILKEVGEYLPESVGLEDDSISYNEWIRLSKLFNKVMPFGTVIRDVRSVKTPYEIECLRMTGKKHGDLYSKIPSLYKKGMTDLELSVEIEHLFRLNGHLGIFRTHGGHLEAFMGTLLAGDNAGTPSPYDFAIGGGGQDKSFPVGLTGRKIEEGETVLVDIAGNFCGYLTDLSRTYPVGKTCYEIEKAYNAAIEIQAITENSKAGVLCSDIWEKSFECAKKYSLEHCFMGLSSKAKFIGHGVGLQMNETPVLTGRYQKPLEDGVCIAIEPKFIIEGVGAVGIENTYLITSKGTEKLTICSDEMVILN
ncbi:MAG: peptidase [Clostridia bacterium]|nr:peptidase [Clostridia bacterium]